jgi:hypothetical protein
MDNIFLRSWHSHRDRNDLQIPSKEIAMHPPVARGSLRAIMTHLVSVARSDTPACDPLASFRRQPAPDFPGGGFTIDVIGVCHLYPGPGGWAAIFASGAEISGGGSATTSDQMYILAATRALDATPIGAIVDADRITRTVQERCPPGGTLGTRIPLNPTRQSRSSSHNAKCNARIPAVRSRAGTDTKTETASWDSFRR